MAATPRNKEAAERALRLQNYAEAIVQYRAHLENHRLLPYLLEYFRQRRPDQQGVVSGG